MQRVLFFAFFLLLYEKAIPQFVRHLGRKKIWIPDTKTFSAPLGHTWGLGRSPAELQGGQVQGHQGVPLQV